MAGWFHNGICYAEQSQAIDAHFQSIQPFILNSSTNTYKTQYVKQVNGTWHLTKQTLTSTGAIANNFSILVNTPTFAECQVPNDPTTNFLNGMELGWAVAGVAIVVFAIRRSYRGF